MKLIIDTEDKRNFIIQHITGFDLSKKKWIIECKILSKKRTIDQNRLYWLWLSFLEKETGNEKVDLHEYFKKKYIRQKEKELFNEKK